MSITPLATLPLFFQKPSSIVFHRLDISRQSNNKFRDRPHMIQAEFENGIEDENNFQI